MIATLCLVGVAVAQASGQAVTRLQANKAAARHDARTLVASLRLPSGATRRPERPLTVSSVGFTGHAKWTIGESQQAVIAYVRHHQPAGARLESSGTSTGPGISSQLTLMYDWPSLGMELYGRSLSISVGALADGGSEIVATSESYWTIPRPRSEQVPSGVRAVEVTLRLGSGSLGLRRPRTTTHVFTGAVTVATIVADLNSLPIVQPGIVYSCTLELSNGPRLTLRFTGASGATLARVQVNVHPGKQGGSGWNACDPIQFWIGNKQQTALTSQSFVAKIARLIGANIS